jgi:hypothetical protein
MSDAPHISELTSTRAVLSPCPPCAAWAPGGQHELVQRDQSRRSQQLGTSLGPFSSTHDARSTYSACVFCPRGVPAAAPPLPFSSSGAPAPPRPGRPSNARVSPPSSASLSVCSVPCAVPCADCRGRAAQRPPCPVWLLFALLCFALPVAGPGLADAAGQRERERERGRGRHDRNTHREETER